METMHASLRRPNKKVGDRGGDTNGGDGVLPPPLERSTSVQDQRPSSMVISTSNSPTEEEWKVRAVTPHSSPLWPYHHPSLHNVIIIPFAINWLTCVVMTIPWSSNFCAVASARASGIALYYGVCYFTALVFSSTRSKIWLDIRQ